MKHLKKFEGEDWSEIVGGDLTSPLSEMYDRWLDIEGLPHLSADEHDWETLSEEQKTFISAFIELWDISTHFEMEYYKDENFVPKKDTNKYNL